MLRILSLICFVAAALGVAAPTPGYAGTQAPPAPGQAGNCRSAALCGVFDQGGVGTPAASPGNARLAQATGVSDNAPAPAPAGFGQAPGSAADSPAPAPGTGSATPPPPPEPGTPLATPTLSDLDRLKAAYQDLKGQYLAIKDVKDNTKRNLLIAGIIAAILKYLIDLIAVAGKFTDRGKKYLPLVALGLAVPIALLSKYAGGVSWLEALIFAGAGPGAVFVNELINAIKPAPKSVPA